LKIQLFKTQKHTLNCKY